VGKTDLHIHSTASDGQYTPSEVVRLAKERNLDIIALTDHDTFSGFMEAYEKGVEEGVEVLSGMEITADYGGRESHLLAYCFDIEADSIKDLQRRHCLARLDRAKQIVDTLQKWGFDLDIEEVKAEARGLNIARPHIATVLVRKGYVANHREAFMRYLKDQMLQHIESGYDDYKNVIQCVREAGGVTVIAHPGLSYTLFDLERFVEAGIDGIEFIHPSHNYKLQKRYEKWAEENQLLVTGGSDFHGSNNNHMQNFGILAVNNELAHRVKRLSRQRKQLSSS